MAEAQEQREQRERRRRPWQAKSVLAAIVVSMLGMALWGYATATRPRTAPGGSGAESRMVTGLSGESAAPAPQTKPRLVDAAGPAVSRFGLSFLGGFALGFTSRKFLRWTLLIAGLLGGGLYLAQRAGLIDLTSSDIERQVGEGVNLAKSQAGNVKKFLTGYIPSATACGVGAFMGFRNG